MSIALFRNGFTREAAVRVAGGDLRALAMLARKSLIRREERVGAATTRYAIHELLRQFAAEELAALPDEQAETEQRYCTYYLTFLSERTTRLQQHDPRTATNEIFSELENIRHVWELAAYQQLLAPLGQSTIALREFYIFAGLLQEGSERFALVIDALRKPRPSGPDAPAPHDEGERAQLLSRLMGYYGSILIAIGGHVNAQTAAEEALQW